MKHKIRHRRRHGSSRSASPSDSHSAHSSRSRSRSRERDREKRRRRDAPKKPAGGERLKRKGSFFEDVHEKQTARSEKGRPGRPGEGEAPGPEQSDGSVADGPCFEPSGILAKFANTVNGVELKFTEPLDSCFPETLWQVFPFKGDEEYDTLNLDFKTCYLFGKDSRVADFRLENLSCSGQHAVVQFRLISLQNPDGTYYSEARPYLMDLNSTNGTFLNDAKIEGQKYYQLLHEDVIRFGLSERKYVVMHNQAERLEQNKRLNERT